MMSADDLVRSATEEMTKVCQEVYDRDGRVDTFVTAYGRRPARQIVAIVEDHVHIAKLAQYMAMAVGAAAVTFVAEAFVKEYDEEPPAGLEPGYLAERAEQDSSIETQVIVLTVGFDRPGAWTDRSTPRLDADGRRVWATTGEPVGDTLIHTYLLWAADHPLPGGPLADEDLDRFVTELEAEGLTPMACLVGGDDG